jgi:hypothetical protein
MNLVKLRTEIDKLIALAGTCYTMEEINKILRPVRVPIDRAKFFWGAFQHSLCMKERSTDESGICMYKPPTGHLGCLLSPFIKNYDKKLEGCGVTYPITQAAMGLDPMTLSDEDIEFLVRLQCCHDKADDIQTCRLNLFKLGQQEGFIPKVDAE